MTAAMEKSPLWPSSPPVQEAALIWSQTADELVSNAQRIADLKNQLRVAEAQQQAIRRKYRASKRQVLSTVSLACEGSADRVKGFCFDVIARTMAGLLAVVDGISTSPGAAPGETTAKWPRGQARNGFVVQHATDAANPATYSAPIPCTKCKYTLSGAVSGSTVYLRVAAIDPNTPAGQTPWSAWIAASVR
jgi:hypothetical protein